MVIYLLTQIRDRPRCCLMPEQSPAARAAGQGNAAPLAPQSTSTRAWGPSTRC